MLTIIKLSFQLAHMWGVLARPGRTQHISKLSIYVAYNENLWNYLLNAVWFMSVGYYVFLIRSFILCIYVDVWKINNEIQEKKNS